MFDQAFWVGFATISFVALAYKPVSKFVTIALDKRSEAIQKQLEDAMKLREEAQNLLDHFKAKQRDAMKEAEDIVAEARTTAQRLTDQAEKDLESAINRRINLAMEKISQAEASMMQDIQASAVDIAVGTARAMLKEQMSRDVAEKLVQAAIADVGRKLH